MADGLLGWCVKKIYGLFADVEKLKVSDQRTDGHMRRLESKVEKISKVQEIQGQAAEVLKNRVADLESQNHGLKVSRGKLKAKLERSDVRN
jgi:hypothetical protein